jgi:hypothetical protein
VVVRHKHGDRPTRVLDNGVDDREGLLQPHVAPSAA